MKAFIDTYIFDTEYYRLARQFRSRSDSIMISVQPALVFSVLIGLIVALLLLP